MIAGLRSAGLSVDEIAEHAGLSRSTLYNLANGTVQRPSYATYERLQRACRAHGIDHAEAPAARPLNVSPESAAILARMAERTPSTPTSRPARPLPRWKG